MQYSHLQYQAAQETDNLLDEAEALNNLGLIYDITKAHDQALEFYQKSHTLHKTLNNTTGITTVLINKTLAYINLQDYPAALADGLQTVDLCQTYRDYWGLIHALGVTGVAYFEMGDYDHALPNFQQALAKAKAIGSKMLEATALKEIGKVYHRQLQINPALDHVQQALKIATEIAAKSEMFECHQLLSEIFEQQNDLTKALHHYKLYHQIEKEVFNDDADRRIKNLQVIHDTETVRKGAEIYRLKNVELYEALAKVKLLSGLLPMCAHCKKIRDDEGVLGGCCGLCPGSF